MPNVQRYRQGDEQQVSSIIKAGDVAQIGDLMAYALNDPNSGNPTEFAVSFSDVEYSISSTTQSIDHAHDRFLGVLIQGATIGTETEDTPCLIGYGAVYEFQLSSPAAGNYRVGTLLLPEEDGDGGFLPDTLRIGSDPQNDIHAHIARAAQVIREGDTTVYALVISTVMQVQLYGQPF